MNRPVDGITTETAKPKLRSRKHGAAIPLDDADKRLMNLLQSSFPLDPHPFAAVAAEAGLDLDDTLERTQRLLDERIIREITPIFDTRALGYSSMLVAAKVDPEYPHRAAQFINSHPGVTHNYLRNHDFNLWFTLAVEPDSTLGLDGTLDVMAAKTGAESIRQLPTLKLFKIRMDLEMEGGTVFCFVTEGFDAAYAQARETAGEGGVDIAGGASTVRQALIAGVVDELTLDVAPVLLGSGERIFEGAGPFGFEPVEVLHSPLATHIRYRRAG